MSANTTEFAATNSYEESDDHLKNTALAQDQTSKLRDNGFKKQLKK